ncbi:hypothetical protein T10_11402 [Trichinella papuae]|uniref:Uncharacterized protein n=1 Tax=Trichinella papuae TaxID=268474 RepID=A0A0V1N1L0_9BILA|nr:hypothetical protein T10_11402 [Trichinella papuae]
MFYIYPQIIIDDLTAAEFFPRFLLATGNLVLFDLCGGVYRWTLRVTCTLVHISVNLCIFQFPELIHAETGT